MKRTHSFRCLAALLAALFLSLVAEAQPPVALVHNGASTIYTAVAAAIGAAQPNDTLYLSGGGYPPFDIDKKITVVGAGYFPDSTTATGLTYVPGISLYPGASECTLTGLLLGNLAINAPLTGITINRCRIGSFSGCGGSVSNWLIRESVLGTLSICGGNPLSASLVSNCIFLGSPGNYTDSEFRNCIFFNDPHRQFCSYYSCVGRPGWPGADPTSQYYDNLNFGENGANGSGNVPNAGEFSTLFVSETNNNYEYADDLHLVNPTYAAYAGIYQGMFVWKPGGVPFNPHISSKTIPAQTNANGELPVNITVRGQGN